MVCHPNRRIFKTHLASVTCLGSDSERPQRLRVCSEWFCALALVWLVQPSTPLCTAGILLGFKPLFLKSKTKISKCVKDVCSDKRLCVLTRFVLCLSSSWCATCGVFPACEPGRSGENKPRGQTRRSFCSEGLYSSSESSNNHTIQEPRGAPEVLALLPTPNSPKAATRLRSICYQSGKMLKT